MLSKYHVVNRSAMYIVTSLSIYAVPVQNQIFLVKMKAPWLLLLIVIQLSSKFLYFFMIKLQINVFLVKKKLLLNFFFRSDSRLLFIKYQLGFRYKALVSCSTIVACKTECYRGYIFTSGSTKENFNCQNGVWTPTLSSCKRTFLVFFFFNNMAIEDNNYVQIQ